MTCNNELLISIEGVECIFLEGLYDLIGCLQAPDARHRQSQRQEETGNGECEHMGLTQWDKPFPQGGLPAVCDDFEFSQDLNNEDQDPSNWVFHDMDLGFLDGLIDEDGVVGTQGIL